MASDLNNPVRLTKAQVKPAAEMLARAFQDYPLSVYFFPDAAEREKRAPHNLQSLVRYGLLYGEVYATSPNLEGAAVWLPSGKAQRTLWRNIRSGGFSMFLRLGMEQNPRQKAFHDYVASVHRRHAPFPHLYLQMIGVDPVHQGRGYGSILLRSMFARIDKLRLPCYLETHVERDVAIYQHHGFKVIHESVIPGTEITHWAMLRGETR